MTARPSKAGPAVALAIGVALVIVGYFLYSMETERHQARSVFAPLAGFAAIGIGSIVGIVALLKLAARHDER